MLYVIFVGRLCSQPVVKLTQDMKRDFYLTGTDIHVYLCISIMSHI
jgi:hypothetical protein